MSNQNQSPSDSDKKSDCLKRLHSILDGEASPDEKKDFVEQHLEQCMPCYKHYHLEMSIRSLLKEKCWNQKAPAELIDEIKSQINNVK